MQCDAPTKFWNIDFTVTAKPLYIYIYIEIFKQGSRSYLHAAICLRK
uniref:Uncharacterized protein n=1 Tax=Arundo donax TaxID=35708 RepID=A0A0A9GMH9_ARUDO